MADDPARRARQALDQGRHRHDLVARGAFGLLAHVDDLQIGVAPELLVADAAHGLDGMEGVRGRAIDIKEKGPPIVSRAVSHAGSLSPELQADEETVTI